VNGNPAAFPTEDKIPNSSVNVAPNAAPPNPPYFSNEYEPADSYAFTVL